MACLTPLPERRDVQVEVLQRQRLSPLEVPLGEGLLQTLHMGRGVGVPLGR